MTTTDVYAGFGTKQTVQTQPVPGRPEQVKNNAGGFVFEIDLIAQLRRFLTIGSAGGTYYVGEKELTRENGELIIALTQTESDHRRLVDTIVEISVGGRAPKQQPTLFALAIACQMGPTPGKQYARSKVTEVVRTGSHLFTFVKYLNQFGGWSRGLRKAVANWYTEKDADALAYQMIKYRQREGYTHRDVLRLSHPKIEAPRKRALINWAVTDSLMGSGPVPSIVTGFVRAQRQKTPVDLLLENYNLPWEALPDSAMNDPRVWDKLLDNGMPITALVRQLPRLTQIGMLPPMGMGRTVDVINQLLNPTAVSKSRIHPFNVLVALKTYASGRSLRGSGAWTPNTQIIDALDEMHYLAFGNVESTGKRIINAIDISGSMGSQAGTLPLTCREVAAAMAMTTIRTEDDCLTLGFTTKSAYSTNDPRLATLVNLPFSRRQRLDDIVKNMSGLKFGGTDCALPMLAARDMNLEVDTFVVYTDNETFHGNVHPFQALQMYRKASGIDAKLVVVSITPSRFSIADPKDGGMLDVSGFDSAVPTLISDFSMGRI